jgi:hypothetical protein
MTRRQLVAIEADPADPQYGAMFGLDPNRATGIPIPAFRVVTTRPAVGTAVGEAVIETTSHAGFVWDGNVWEPIAPSAVTTFADDTTLLANASLPAGSYGASASTGNLFIKTPTGWRQVGTRVYPNTAALLAATASDGQDAISLSSGLAFTRVAGKWVPKTNWVATETQITGDTTLPDGTVGVASDTGHIFVRSGGAWVGSPVMHYPTEVLLLAATPPNGVIAIAEDTGIVFSRTAAGWRRVNAAASVVSATAPVNPAIGEIWSQTGGNSKFWNGSQWVGIGGDPIGAIKMWPSMALPPGYLLCDGATIDAKYTELIKWCGPKVPDLRGQFVRGATNQANISGFTKHAWTTGRPKTAFTTDSQGNHFHDAGGPTLTEWANYGSAASNVTGASSGVSGGRVRPKTSTTGAHTHTVTGGGDSETAPDHVYLAFIIKAE